MGIIFRITAKYWINLCKSLFVYTISTYLLCIRRYPSGIGCLFYLVFNSKPSFLYLITSSQLLGSQRGVQMEVPRDQNLCIHKLLEPNFFRFWSALTRYKCGCKKIPKYHLLVKWIGGAAVAHSTLVPWHQN